MANTQTTVPIFTAAQVLTAAQLNNSAATGVPVFATTVTRDAGFGGAGEKALAEGQLCYLESTNVVQYYDGAAWATVGPAPAVSSGLAFITSGSFSAVSQGTVTGCFSSSYDNYKVILDGTDFAGDLYLLFGISGTITSLTNTDWNVINCASGSVGGLGSTNVTRQLIQRNATYGTINLEIIAPNLAKETKVTSVYGGTLPGTSGIVGSSGGATKNSAQFTDFTIRSDAHPSGSITFSYRVYGYANS